MLQNSTHQCLKILLFVCFELALYEKNYQILNCEFVFVVLFQLSCTTTDSTFLVRRIIDGDTIVVYRNNQSFKVRLAEIDCPEKRQSFGLKAKQFLSKLILNRKVERHNSIRRSNGTRRTFDRGNV